MMPDRLARLAAMTAVLGLPACTVTMVDAAMSPAAYAPIDMAGDYGWIDRADALWEAIGDAPPDYAFVFEGAEPWAWETADGHRIVVEDAGEGGIRSYYFAPGEMSPFLAVEPGASFGFVGSGVAMVYGPDGGALPRSQWGFQPERGMQLFARARLLSRAMGSRDRRGVDADAWNDTSGLILNFVTQWDSARRRHPGWRTHRNSAEAAGRRERLERERDRRRGEAGQFQRWRQGGFRGTPPPGFEPHRPGGPRAGRPPQPGQPAPGVGGPERPRTGEAPSVRPEADVLRRPRAGAPRMAPRSKAEVEMPVAEDVVAPLPAVSAQRPERPERPDRARAEPRPQPMEVAAPYRAPAAPPPPAEAPPPPPTYAPPPPPSPPADRPRPSKLEPEEEPN